MTPTLIECHVCEYLVHSIKYKVYLTEPSLGIAWLVEIKSVTARKGIVSEV